MLWGHEHTLRRQALPHGEKFANRLLVKLVCGSAQLTPLHFKLCWAGQMPVLLHCSLGFHLVMRLHLSCETAASTCPFYRVC